MKTIKNNHEFELKEYENEVTPISDNHVLLENNVRDMNSQIMNQYSHKVNTIEEIKTLSEIVQTLREKKKATGFKRVHGQNKFNRLAERLIYLATHPFEGNIRHELQLLLADDDTHEYAILNEEKETYKHEGEKLVRYKNMIRRQIEEEEKREEHTVRNQHEFFKYHNENATLLREFNELKKVQQLLIGEVPFDIIQN